ncbi:MAG TPA: aspartate--tRNA ligase [Fimbriimonadaceae bacterium]|nr:aspartate--tRNA ligase [Fimbriimonadaceae bacterium]HRJ33807.1 aspartate--tRNA ligase [Fimbriimonadaceae bacterium]
MSFAQRTVSCGHVRLSHAGEAVTLNGWAHKVRDLGGLFFVDLRDRTGLVQLILDPEKFPQHSEIRPETCLSVTGSVRERAPETKNALMATGEIEVVVESYQVLNPCKTLPFPVSDEAQMQSVNEELRVKHRYLDLRRPSMARKMAIRAAAVRRIRAYLDAREFYEIETPIFTKSTPEGARDYLVPYRLQPGQFYALPQSPQQYKQLLMVAGLERYYQIAKCFRDEAQRSDRQPEFTQLDLEMSFVTQEDVLQLAEGLTLDVVNGLIDEFELEKEKISSFTRLTYDESMRRYGCDKPDLRFGLELFDLTEIVRNSEFGVFRSVAEEGGVIRGVRFPGGAQLSRKDISDLENFCKEYGAKGMATFQVDAEPKPDHQGAITAQGWAVRSPIAKFFSTEQLEKILQTAEVEAGDMICLIAGNYAEGNNILYRLRNEIGQRCGLRDPKKLAFCYVLDFPLVEWDADSQRWSPSHHPFTAPKHEDLQYLESDPGRIRAECYDIVCNGTEWASGSIRIHRPDIQAKVFDLLGIDAATQQSRFGHILEAFQFGAPPHGGIAPGIDRLIMFLTDEENIREVIAFPKMGSGYDPMMDAPSQIDPQQWAELGLRLS